MNIQQKGGEVIRTDLAIFLLCNYETTGMYNRVNLIFYCAISIHFRTKIYQATHLPVNPYTTNGKNI